MTNPEGTPEGQEGTVEGVGEQEGTDYSIRDSQAVRSRCGA